MLTVSQNRLFLVLISSASIVCYNCSRVVERTEFMKYSTFTDEIENLFCLLLSQN